jgi:hypothetical protein
MVIRFETWNDVKETGYEDVDWIHLTQDRVQCGLL